MDLNIDFYSILKKLIEQIPESNVSTPHYLARALGDSVAIKAVSDVLKREEFIELSIKIRTSLDICDCVYTDFKSDKPLKKLGIFQRNLSKNIILNDCFIEYDLVAGVDASYLGDKACAACVVVDKNFEVIESSSAVVDVRFPYIPSYLSFREALPLIEAIKKLSNFDVLMINGHGLAHPRKCGLASHVGLNFDVPTIGIARRRLIGSIGEKQNCWSHLVLKNAVIGAVLKRHGFSSIYVSVGHKISLKTSMDIVSKTLLNNSLPEPLMMAHRKSNEIIKQMRDNHNI